MNSVFYKAFTKNGIEVYYCSNNNKLLLIDTVFVIKNNFTDLLNYFNIELKDIESLNSQSKKYFYDLLNKNYETAQVLLYQTDIQIFKNLDDTNQLLIKGKI